MARHRCYVVNVEGSPIHCSTGASVNGARVQVMCEESGATTVAIGFTGFRRPCDPVTDGAEAGARMMSAWCHAEHVIG